MGKRRRSKVDLCSILRASDHARAYREWIDESHRNMAEDPRKAERLAKGECVVCFYPQAKRIGGAMMTSAQCGICQKMIHSASTNIDTVCPECARAHDLCRHCGADVRLRTRRKFDQSAVMETLEDDRP